MAERRMFAKTIIDSDAFLDMPLSTQALYFHLSMRADDDGFINNPKKIQRMVGASGDDLKLLIAKNFIIPFESGIVVIKHWKIHNYIRSDRYKETVYAEEKASLDVKENGAYTFGIPNDAALDTVGIPDGYQMDTQVRLGQDSVGKDSVSINSASQPSSAAVDAFFDSVWKLYPVKKGKGQVSKSKRLALYKIGFDELSRAVTRYTEDLKKDAAWRKPQNGSTFFNSGYVDYLDANYTPDERMNTNGSNQSPAGQAQRIGHYI